MVNLSSETSSGLTRITTDVDFDQEGRQDGFLRLPYSVHRSAYGWLPVPIIVFKNGPGPRVLLVSGNHGDEYEGQVTLLKLARSLRVEDVHGELIILPAANYPAVMAGERSSPSEPGELGNLNRSFPGSTSGSATAMMAHYIDTVLLARVEYVIDLHSGGSSLMYIPSADIKVDADPAKTNNMIEIMRVFGAPISYVGIPDIPGNLAVAARKRSLIHLGTELGGAGTVTLEILKIAEQGVRRVLGHIGSISGHEVPEAQPTRLMYVGGPEYYVYSPNNGIFEPYVELGEDVEAGQPAGCIHFPDTPWRDPESASFRIAGKVICSRQPSLARRGDCLYQIATDIPSGLIKGH
jgi:predicted deacylase